MGEMCEAGICVQMAIPDAGPPPVRDAGPQPDGSTLGIDGGLIPSADGGRRRPVSSPGCGCRTGTRTPGTLLGIGSMLLFAFALRRRQAATRRAR
jgi:hypothetical protein